MHSIDNNGDPMWRATSSSGGAQPRRNSPCETVGCFVWPLQVSLRTRMGGDVGTFPMAPNVTSLWSVTWAALCDWSTATTRVRGSEAGK
ncbi:hypothetical protein ElyMa_000026100 [Elysia marginata]|uniref:Uncharacterized protein n=1 Tax=Elysia marginata TaxID=1093978 RepID=A0AAV4EC66_9GAST|nr:hypothetical protein ElyMa_000026100 [Elysia marginata]